MPAMNMGGTVAGNPSLGKFIIMDPLSGPKGSPRDNDKAGNYSTGALSTGIGFGGTQIIGPTAPQSIKDRGFTANYVPGLTNPDNTTATLATLLYIGGGRSNAMAAGVSVTNPWNAQPILGFGNGGSRDAGAGPAFTGFGLRMVTATAGVAAGGVIATVATVDYANRSGNAMVANQSAFGSSSVASPVAA